MSANGPVKLQNDVIYGPVPSRRLGRSLGVNLLPTTFKICSFNCAYCQYGWTQTLTNHGNGYKEYFPSVQRVTLAIRDALQNRRDFDYLTFSGNGEPTLHPYFPQIIEIVIGMKAFFRLDVKLAVLSNSTTCGDPQIREALNCIDLPIMKLDAGNERMFKRINHGKPPVTFDTVVAGLKSLDRYVVQTMFVTGGIDNSSEAEVASWIAVLSELRPQWVQIYSLDRPAADKRLQRVAKERLQQIADLAEKQTGNKIEVF